MSHIAEQALKCSVCGYLVEICRHTAGRMEKLERVWSGLEELTQRTEANGDMADQAVNAFVKELMR